ncbi:MAG: hypothetical protein U0531_03320 [Dehalococcoidia bacterium]
MENGVAIMDERLSRRHARIGEFREGVYLAERPRTSTNGTTTSAGTGDGRASQPE